MNQRIAATLAMFCLPFLSAIPAMAQGSPVGSSMRSDSINLLHAQIALDLSTTASGTIRGDAAITFVPRVPGITQLPLDLLLPVDSVVMGGMYLGFTHPGEVLYIDLPESYGPADTLTLTVSYHGNPATDPSGFGGFYTLSTYQYNLGVAFQAIPHSYGRAWFPCFDNFVERCSLDFFVRTDTAHTVFANGALQEITDLGNGEQITHWQIAEPIPSYLASVASGHYAALTDTFPSVSGADVPVVLAALPADTAQMRASFSNLQDAFNIFEQWFGPYQWNRVGFVLTNAGAMEHATNICYPDFAADGTLGNEDLIAHELSHHWFGNLVTCARPEEMYINEGFANFCAMLYMGALYGPDTYSNLVRNNHHDVVAGTHLEDGGWYALSEVPQSITYGETSYKKGADIARTLRSTLGDSLFSAGFKRVFSNNAYMAMGSATLRDSLAAATGTDLDDFFNNWIFQPGGATFMVDSFSVSPAGGNYDVLVHVRQKSRGGAELFQGVPVTVSCIGADGEIHRSTVDMGGASANFNVSCPFLPEAVRLNDDERLALSTTVDTATITFAGLKYFNLADVTVITPELANPTFLRIEEFWVPADHAADGSPYFISPDRWWRVEGDIQPGTEMNLRITVDGRANTPSGYDQGLMQNAGTVAFVEDSLCILYRPNPSVPWVPMPVDISHIGSHTDKYARIDMPGFAAGDYTLAWRMQPTGLAEHQATGKGWRYFPDPASGRVTVVAPPQMDLNGAQLLIRDMGGRLLASQRLHASSTMLDVSRIAPQAVLLSVRRRGGREHSIGLLHIVH